MARRTKSGAPKQVETLTHDEAKRKNIPTAELQSAAQRAEELKPFEPVVYKRQNPLAKGEKRPRDEDLDPQMVWRGARIRLTEDQIREVVEKGYIDIDEAQIVWRGKDQQDWSDLVVQAPPLYIQEKIHPKVIIDDLMRRTKEGRKNEYDTLDLFSDFNGVDPEAKTEFYQHDQNWSNRMILGDSLQVTASLAEREGLRGQVQCIYFDPPYGIKFNSNWQVSTRSRDVSDGKIDQITREPEQVKAFRDTWKDGIHSYLTYMRDRLTAMRDLLTESGSIFVQIGDENVHRVRALMDEVFGEENFVSQISVKKTAVQTDLAIPGVVDFIIWFCKSKNSIKYRPFYLSKGIGDPGSEQYRWIRNDGADFERIKEQKDFSIEKLCRPDNLTSSHEYSRGKEPIIYRGKQYVPGGRYWSTSPESITRLGKSDRLHAGGKDPKLRQIPLRL